MSVIVDWKVYWGITNFSIVLGLKLELLANQI